MNIDHVIENLIALEESSLLPSIETVKKIHGQRAKKINAKVRKMFPFYKRDVYDEYGHRVIPGAVAAVPLGAGIGAVSMLPYTPVFGPAAIGYGAAYGAAGGLAGGAIGTIAGRAINKYRDKSKNKLGIFDH